MVTDTISDFIIQIKNASDAGKASVALPYSKMKAALADVLQKEGFIKSASKKGKKLVKTLDIELVYQQGTPKIQGVQRISKVSKRLYYGVKDIKSVRQGFGRLILTTPKGILTDKEARAQKVGGEPLFKIW